MGNIDLNQKKKIKIFCSSQKNSYNYKLKSFTETETLDYIINFNTLKNISTKNFEPTWIFQFRKNSLTYFYKMNQPSWSECSFDTNDFSKMIFYSATLKNNNLVIQTPDNENSNTKTAVGLVIDSIS